MERLLALGDVATPQLLIFYGAVILATLVTCRFWPGLRDPTRKLPTSQISNDFDPVEIAYLRDGEIAVTRLTIFGLLQCRYLEIIKSKRWLTTREEIQQALSNLRNATPDQY